MHTHLVSILSFLIYEIFYTLRFPRQLLWHLEFLRKKKDQCSNFLRSFADVTFLNWFWQMICNSSASWTKIKVFFVFASGRSSSSSSSDRYCYKKVTGHWVFSSCLHRNHCWLFFPLSSLRILWLLMDSQCQRSMLETFLVLVVCIDTKALCPRFCCTTPSVVLELSSRDCVVFIKSSHNKASAFNWFFFLN